jgi:hypothetical protein
MRIKIIGESDTAKALRGLLRKAGFAVCEFLPAEVVMHAPDAGYAITIEEGEHSGWIHLDSVDSELEAAVFKHITQLSPHPVSVDRPGGVVHSERELRIIAPAGDAAQAQAVEYGVLRGLLELLGPKPLKMPEPPQLAKFGLWKRLAGVFGLCLLSAASVHAGPHRRGEIVIRTTDDAGGALTLRLPSNLFTQLQQPGSGSNVNLSQIGGASVAGALYDSANTAMKVNCVVGCSATGSFTDNGAFTAGSTAVTNISGLFNDAAAALTSGNAGAIRATSDRMLYVNIGKIAGTAPTLTGSSLNVNCTGGCGASASFSDNSAFTAGTTTISNTGGVFNDGLAAVTSSNAAAFRITSNRGLHVNLRNNSGTELASSTSAPAGSELGLIVRNIPSGTQAVSGTVTANIGTTGGLALDASVTGLEVAQASTTSGQKGILAQCAVTTGAPAYTTAQTDPLSCDTSGNLRVNPGTVTIAANSSVNLAQVAGSSTVTGGVAGLLGVGGNAASGAADSGNPVKAGCVFNTTQPTVTTGQRVDEQCSARGAQIIATGADTPSFNLSQVGGTAIVTGGVAGTQGVGGTTANGSAVGGNPFQIAGNASGNVTRAIFCDNWTKINQTAGAQLITGAATKQTYVCNLFIYSATAQNAALVEGTGTVCATGILGLMGGSTAATGQNLAANQGFVLPASTVPWAKTVTAADNVCLLQSGTGQISGVIVWTQF